MRINRLLHLLSAFAALLVCCVTAPAQAVREISVPKAQHNGIAVGSDGTIYIVESDKSAILIVRPNKTRIEARTITAGSNPMGIQFGPDGNLWFVEVNASNIGVMQPDGTMLAEFATRCRPGVIITPGSGNVMWFGEDCSDSTSYITRITASGTMTRYLIGSLDHPLPRLNEGVIEAGDGNIWFVEQLGNAVGRLNPTTGRAAEFPIPSHGAGAAMLFAGPDGNLWLPELPSRAKLARVALDGVITEFDWPGEVLNGLGVGADGNFWGVDDNAGVWRIDISDAAIHATSFYPGTLLAGGTWLTTDSHRNIWFSEVSNCVIGVLDFDGVFDENFDSPTCP